MKKFGYILLSAIALALACNKPEEEKPQPKPDPPKPEAPKIEIPAESQAIFSQGISLEAGTQEQSQTVKFTANQAWTADATDVKSSTWLSVQPTSGSAGTVTLTVSAQPNNGKLDREASVTIKCGTVSQKFTVKQAGIPDVEVSSVTLDKKALELVEGDGAQLSATVLPEDATDKTVTWSTDQADVATVDETGQVSALREGLASIIAKAGEFSDTCVVTVAKKFIPVETVTLSKKSLELVEGDEAQLSATVLPEDATDPAVTWSTDKADIATVDEAGKVTAVKEGLASIIAKAGEKADTCTVTVARKFIPVTSVTLDKTALKLVEGDEATLTATVKPDDATDKTVTWSTSNATVATVADGKIVAVAPGSAIITATSGEKSASCAVVVEKKFIPVTTVTLDKTTLELVEGDEATLSATVKPDDATDKTVTWSTSNAAVATVADGKVVAVAPGSATITAKAGEKSATCAVTVAKKVIPVSGISLDNTSVALKEGQEIQLAAAVTPENATDKTVTWSSDKTHIATVDNTGKVKAVAEGTAVVTAKAGEKTATCTVTVSKNVVPVTSVTLDKTSLNMTKGQETTLKATVAPDNATDKTVTWSTSDASVATVENGKVKAVGGGSATITAKSGEKSATCAVTVTVPVSSVALDKTTLDVTEGDEASLTATVNPSDATDKTVTWSSDKPEFATVDQTGKVKAVAPGSAVITAKAGDKSATCTVTVARRLIPATAITLDRSTAELFEGDRISLQATVTPSNTTDEVQWSSSNPAAATVNNEGVVSGVAAGTTAITVKAGAQSATCQVTVKAAIPVTSVELNKTEITVEKGQTEPLTATVKPDEATHKTVTWRSDNTKIATVNSSGVVTGRGNGTTTIRAKSGNVEATCTVTVTVPATRVSLNKQELTLNVGASETLVPTVAPNNATDKTVTWNSDKTQFATVDDGGKVTAVAAGDATITVTTHNGKTAACIVHVVVPDTGVTLDQTSITLNKGGSQTLVATILPAEATNKKVTWTSSDSSVATVDADGKVKAVGGGTATITVTTACGHTATCGVTVIVPVESVSLNRTNYTLVLGNSFTLKATVNPGDATNKTVSWDKGGSDKVEIQADGTSCTVTALALGESITVTVTTQDGSKTASCTFTVKEEDLENTEGYGDGGQGEWGN